jgi:hypothetical protein
MRAFKSAITLWSAFWRSMGLGCASVSKRRRKSKSLGRRLKKNTIRREPRNLYFLIYRLPKYWFPDANYTTPIGGLVLPIEQGGLVESVACQRYHIAPYEWLFSIEVTNGSRQKRRQALRLHVLWEQEMAQWMEEVTSG